MGRCKIGPGREYNRGVRIGSFLLLILTLAGCHRGAQAGKDAVREGVLDYLSGRKDLSIGSMNVEVTSVQFDGNTADATVAFSPKGVPSSQGMTMRYQLEQQGSRWVVVSHQDSGHAASVAPGGPNPHGGGAVPQPSNPHGGGGSGAGAHMPSPEDLPPTGGKK
jgi:hypothetical protein